jgi:glucose-6-phosphate 1-dehydrogenase
VEAAAAGHPLRVRRVRRRRRVPPPARDGGEARRRTRHDGKPRVLPVDPAARLPDRRQAAEASGLVDDKSNNPDAWRRVVIEKPFGSDLQTARELNATLEVAFPADSIFRIDHYLGKETVQNILALRFANELYEPICGTPTTSTTCRSRWPRTSVSADARLLRRHRRGARRHPEPPSPAARADRDGGAHLDGREGPAAEKEKVLAAVRLPDDLSTATARGQYGGGWQGGEKVTGFLEEDGMNPDSTTETYAAVKLEIATRRWAACPSTCARASLGRRVTEIAVVFKRAHRSCCSSATRRSSSDRTRS